MKENKQVFVLINEEWKEIEFRLMKEKQIFSFDKNNVFTASCDPFIIENEGMWSVLVVNKDLERLQEESRKERESFFKIL